MQSRQRPSSQYSESDPFTDIAFKVIVVILCVPLAPAMVLGFVLGRVLKGRHWWFLVACSVCAFVCGAALYFFFQPLAVLQELLDALLYQEHHPFEWIHLVQALVPIWERSCLLVPCVGVGFALFSSQSVERKALEGVKQGDERLRSAARRARGKLKNVPYSVDGQGVLGVSIAGDLLWNGWKGKSWFVLPTRELGQHGIVVGSSGSGKTETLLRIAMFVAKVLGWQVVYVDAKGDYGTAARFIAMMRSIGIKRVRCFPSENYNGWVGDRDALLNRLLAIEDYSESPYYRAIAENIVALALDAGPSLPTSSTEFLRRLRFGNLLSYYKDVIGDVEATAYLEGTAKKDLAGVYNRYRATFGKLRSKLDGAWSYDNVDAAYILLDGLALREIASGLGRYFVEDFAHYVGLRKPAKRRVLYIFDELSAVDADTTNLFERVRSKGATIFVSGQSYEGLGYKGQEPKAARLVSAATTIILHACSDPEELVRRAGKQKVVETGYGFEDEERGTGKGTVRLRDELRVDPDRVRTLGVGEVYVIAHGRAQCVQVAQVQVSEQEYQQAEDYVNGLTVSPPSVQAGTSQPLSQTPHSDDTQDLSHVDPDLLP